MKPFSFSIIALKVLLFALCCTASLTGHAQRIYKCSLPGERVVYSDRKCDPLETRNRLKITDNLMDGIGSTRETDHAALQIARLNSSPSASFPGEGNASYRDATESPQSKRWTGDGEKFTIYSPLLGPGMYFER